VVEKRNREVVTIALGRYRAGRAEIMDPGIYLKAGIKGIAEIQKLKNGHGMLSFSLEATMYMCTTYTCLYLLPAFCGLCPAFSALNIVVPADW
jgi:hypothetical protein